MTLAELVDRLMSVRDQAQEVYVEHTPLDSTSVKQGICGGYEPVNSVWVESNGVYLVHDPKEAPE